VTIMVRLLPHLRVDGGRRLADDLHIGAPPTRSAPKLAINDAFAARETRANRAPIAAPNAVAGKVPFSPNNYLHETYSDKLASPIHNSHLGNIRAIRPWGF